MKKLVSWNSSGKPRARFAALSLALLLVGCDRNEVKVYQVEREAAAPTGSGGFASSAMAASETPGQPALTWTLPAGWQEAPLGQMRFASFTAADSAGKKADVSIVQMGGMAGGELGNVNRWRGQVGLAPVSTEELAKLGESVECAGSGARLYDMAGASAAGDKARILAVGLQRDDVSWFFKMTGDEDWVASQKPKFIAFLKSLKFASAGAAPGALPPGHPALGGTVPALPLDHPPIGGTAETPAAESLDKPQWVVPSGWKEEPATQMLLAKYSVGDPNARAEITISSFPGDVGGLPANINRWRRQLALPPLDDAAATQAAAPLEVQAAKASLVDLQGSDPRSGKPVRLLGIVIPHEGETWFFKILGNETAVASQKEAFIKFVQSAKLSHAR